VRSALTLLLAAVLGTRAAAQSRSYVHDTATGANDGTSWADAFTDLQSAIGATPHGGEIWVAAGTYRTSPIGDRSAAFRPASGQRIYGGFAGNETDLSQRAGLFDQTILSGDLAGDDGPDFTHRSDNSEHILTFEFGTFGAAIDGFTIRGSHAERSAGGGAWYFDGFGDPRALNCTFADNDARNGGAAGRQLFRVLVRRLHLPQELRGYGRCRLPSAPRRRGYLDFTRCRFLGNVAGTRRRSFAGAWAGFADSLFSGNRADGTSEGRRDPRVRLHHALHRVREPGSRRSARRRHPRVGRAARVHPVGNLDDRGTIAEAQYQNDYDGWTRIDECCIQGWRPDLAGGLGGQRVLSGDPEFVDPLGADGILGTRDDDLHLGRLSPCIDVLPPTSGLTVDLDGAPRQHESRSCANGVLDLGAYERQWLDHPPIFCPATASSLGVPARIEARCLIHLGGGPLDVDAAPVPDGNGLLLLGSARTQEPFGNGFRCVGGRVYPSRMQPANGGTLHFRFDPAHFPGAAIAGGSTWNLQAIYRDPAAGGARVNASEAIAVTILP
jgi:hypothetical protein